jgi:hypothetical protein
MSKHDYSAHQQKIIKRYYDNVDSISLHRLGEVVTELYLAEGKKLDRLWTTVESLMQKLKVPTGQQKVILESKSIVRVAALVQELQSKMG